MFITVQFFLFAAIAWTSFRLWHILPFPSWGKWLCTGICLLSFLALFLHFIFGNRMCSGLAGFTYVLGSSSIIFFAYLFMAFMLLWAGRLLHLVPSSFMENSVAGSCTVIGAVALLLVYGNLHYNHKYREELHLTTAKTIEKPLTIVLASDLHAGYHIRRGELSRWVDMINAEHPDLVLFAGDIMDGSLRPVTEGNYAELFRRIDAPVFACLGNHEYHSGREGCEDFFRDAGITLLRDSSAVCKGIRIIGRDDRSNPRRRPLAELLPEGEGFSIVLDHQPFHLEEAVAAGLDFQFSGHTHHGQIWPGNLITDSMYEKAFGAHSKGKTNYYVSSGLGLWGGKFRIGSRSEYVVLKLEQGSPDAI